MKTGIPSCKKDSLQRAPCFQHLKCYQEFPSLWFGVSLALEASIGEEGFLNFLGEVPIEAQQTFSILGSRGVQGLWADSRDPSQVVNFQALQGLHWRMLYGSGCVRSIVLCGDAYSKNSTSGSCKRSLFCKGHLRSKLRYAKPKGPERAFKKRNDLAHHSSMWSSTFKKSKKVPKMLSSKPQIQDAGVYVLIIYLSIQYITSLNP